MASLIYTPAWWILLLAKASLTNITAAIIFNEDCSSFILNDENSCKSKAYWKSVAIHRCSKLEGTYVSPQWSENCFPNMYRKVIAYCCPTDESSTKINGSEMFQNQILNFTSEDESNEMKDNESKLTLLQTNENILRKYLENRLFTSNMSYEKANYNTVKHALAETYALRHSVLETELKDAESHFSDEEWTNHPELSQNAEENIHNEFRQKFLTLDEDEDIDRQNVERVYRDLIFNQIERRNKVAISRWEQVLTTSKLNMTLLMQTAQHLLHVIQRNRHTSLLYYQQMMAVSGNLSESHQWLEEGRKSLSDLELLLQVNLLKLNKFPELNKTIQANLQKYRLEKYTRLDEAIRTILSMPVLSRARPSLTKKEQSLHNANLIIEKYRHRPEKQSSSPQSSSYSDGKLFEQPSMIRVDQAGSVKNFRDSNDAGLEKKGQEENRIDKTVQGDPSTTTSDASTKSSLEQGRLKVDIVPTKQRGFPTSQMTRDPQAKRAHVTTVNSYSPAAVIVTYVSMGILLPVVLFVTVRWGLRRYRRYRERSGYTLTTVQVDERLNRWAGEPPADLSTSSVGRTFGENRLARWQTSGYVNPAYRHKEAYFPHLR